MKELNEGHGKGAKDNFVVTFLVGNGFDLGLGLRTRYSDFLREYLAKESNSEVIAQLKEAIRNNKAEFWSDAELAFGRLPFSTFGRNAHDVLMECRRNFGKALSDYLRSEAGRFRSPDNELRGEFSDMLFAYYEALGEYPRRNELGRLSKFSEMKVNIVNFNYTETIDEMLVKSKKYSRRDSGPVHVEVGRICHVHGALSTQYSHLFGVDERAQVLDAGLSDELKDLLVKSTIDRWGGCGLEPEAKGMIDESDTVVVFGMSMGATDKSWWRYLVDYLEKDSERRLCLVPYVNCQHGETNLAEEGEWAQAERRRFYDAGEAKKLYFLDTDNLDWRIYVCKRGPYIEPDGKQMFCDPFCLTWFGSKLVAEKSIR